MQTVIRDPQPTLDAKGQGPAIRNLLAVVAVALIALPGCRSGGRGLGPAEELSVRNVKVQPFTRLASFDDDELPDGLTVWVQALDAFGDPVKVVGDINFELYTFRNASGERKGDRLIFWERTIRSRGDQTTFWDRPSQMYHFELAWDEVPTAGEKYIIAVTLNTPDEKHFFDEYEVRFNIEALREQLTGP